MTHLALPYNWVVDPFEEFVFLNQIWPEPYHSSAREATKEDCQIGQVFLIMNGSNVVGITGIFFEPENDSDVFLRWTGIAPGWRGKGIARDAMQQLILLCKGWLGDRKRLVELVPDNEYGNTVVKPFFEAIGFVESKIGKHEETDWPTKAYAYKLR
jgi:GNAT superfamily N-acetyltransferase